MSKFHAVWHDRLPPRFSLRKNVGYLDIRESCGIMVHHKQAAQAAFYMIRS